MSSETENKAVLKKKILPTVFTLIVSEERQSVSLVDLSSIA